MAIDATDWTITRSTGDIRYTGDDHGGASPTYATVIEFHRWLQGLADDASSVPASSDELDITDLNPSARSTDNIITLLGNYNIDDNAAEHLYDGSIIQGSGTTETIYDGIVNFGNASVQIQLHQDGAVLADDWWNQAGAGLNADAVQGISHRFLVKVREFGYDIDARKLLGTCRTFNNTYSEFPINATARGNNVLALADADDLNNDTAAGTVAGWTGITNVNEGLSLIDVDNNAVNEEYYSTWNTNQPTRTINEFYERLKWLTRDGSASTLYGINGELFRGITHEIDYDTEVAGGLTELGKAAWGTTFDYNTELASGLTVGEYYVFGTGGAMGKLIALDDDGTAGSCVFAMETLAPGYTAPVNTETFVRADGTATDGATVASVPVGGTDVGGEGLVLATDGVDKVWIQLLSGSAPTDGMVLWDATIAGVYDADAGGSVAVNVTVTPRTVATPFVGVSTGSALIGAYGVGIEAADLSNTDTVFDLTNTQIFPPNNVTFTVLGTADGQDRLLVGPWDGSTLDVNGDPEIDYNQMLLSGAHTSATQTTITVQASIPTDTPASGDIRVLLDDGRYFEQAYTSFTGAVFTIPSTDYSVATGNGGASNGANVWIAYLDLLVGASDPSFTFVYNADRKFVIKSRDGGATPTKESIGTGTMGVNGGNATILRTTDA